MTKEIVQEKFQSDYRWLFRGVLAIHNQQTADEKKTESTNHNNHRGFTGADAKFLTSIANQIWGGFGLSPKQVFVTRKKMMKYAAQCANLAKKGIKLTHFGKLDESVRWTEVKNAKEDQWVKPTKEWAEAQEAAFQKSQLERAQDIVDEINRRGPGSATVGCFGSIISFDEDGHMRDL